MLARSACATSAIPCVDGYRFDTVNGSEMLDTPAPESSCFAFGRS